MVGGDTDRAQRTLAALQEQAGAARAATADPGWRLGRRTPLAGDDLAAVRQIAVAIDELARQAFPTLLRTDLTSLVPTEGRLDLARLKSVSADLSQVDAAVQQTRRGPEQRCPPTSLVSQIAAGADRPARPRSTGWPASPRAADQAARLLPPLLGADGPRRYLLVSQNPAELRATGGMFGAYAVIQADGGRVRMGRQGSSAPSSPASPRR